MKEQDFRALTLFYSEGGNTKKVAYVLHRTLRGLDLEADILEIEPDLQVDYLDYHLVLLGSPVFQFLPAEPVIAFLRNGYRSRAHVLPAAPEQPGHYSVVFCTYGGTHCGEQEAVPALKYMGQFLQHAGSRVVAEWALVGQWHDPARESLNTAGRLGDIRGRPNEADLKELSGRLLGLLRSLQRKLPITLPES